VLTDITDDNFDLDRSKKVLVNHLRNDITSRYDYTFKGFNDAILKQVQGNFKIGRGGYLHNPAKNREDYVGWRMNREGQMLYDDKEVAKKIKNGEEFTDPWQNEYVPVLDNKGGVVGYNVRDGATGRLITDDKEVDGVTITGQPVFYTKVNARRNAVGVKYD